MLIIRPTPLSSAVAALVLLLLPFRSITGSAAQPDSTNSLESLLPRLKPASPQQSLQTFQVEPGFKMELAAAEPNVSDPSAMAWDENGRLFVCELWNYPGVPKAGEPLGRIRLLEDTDGDGVYDKATIFADQIRWPGGIACWNGGVYVISAPDVLFLKDSTGSGRANVRTRVITGFKGETYEIANTLQWGLDNQFYGSASYAGGAIHLVDHPDQAVVQLRQRDWSFDPRHSTIAPVSGSGEFGNSFDDWGNRFTCSANTMFVHGVIPARYLSRNPFFPSPDPAERSFSGYPAIYSISQPEPWRVVRKQLWSRWVNSSSDMRASRFPESELAGRGHLTSGSGITIYRGSAYPQAYRGNAFLGEPANNVVIRLHLEPDGAGFKVIRPADATQKEFIASTEDWFRPVNFANGPDGCLYIASMYREVIEDETAIPNDILKHLDLYSGRERGRIYRIVPENFVRPKPPRLGQATAAQLVAALEHPDGWWRDTAQRLLYERQDKAAVKPLRQLARASLLPQACIHALYALEGLDALDSATLLAALDSSHGPVREHAARLAENHFAQSPRLKEKLCALAHDPEIRVRFQTALSLGALSDEPAVAALAAITQQDPNDRWITTAVLISAAASAEPLLEHLSSNANFSATGNPVFGRLARIIGTRNDPRDIERFLHLLADAVQHHPPMFSTALLQGFAAGLNAAGSSLSIVLAEPANAQTTQAIQTVFAASIRAALDQTQNVRARQDAIELLAYAAPDIRTSVFKTILNSTETLAIQIAAVRALSSTKEPDVAPLLLRNWRQYSPALRREVLDALLRRPERIHILLDSLENGKPAPGELDAAQQSTLLQHSDPGIRNRSALIFSRNVHPDRQQLVAKYRAALLQLHGNPQRGADIFEKNCAVCHRHSPRENVGPKLGGLADRSPETLLVSILDPNREVKPPFVNFTVSTKDGLELSGIIVNDTDISVTLRRPGGEEDNVLRKNIESLRSSALSLMPEGLENGINPQDMADLIQFLQTFQDRM